MSSGLPFRGGGGASESDMCDDNVPELTSEEIAFLYALPLPELEALCEACGLPAERFSQVLSRTLNFKRSPHLLSVSTP